MPLDGAQFAATLVALLWHDELVVLLEEFLDVEPNSVFVLQIEHLAVLQVHLVVEGHLLVLYLLPLGGLVLFAASQLPVCAISLRQLLVFAGQLARAVDPGLRLEAGLVLLHRQGRDAMVICLQVALFFGN